MANAKHQPANAAPLKVCVVTPSLNSGSFLDAALFSVLRQSHPDTRSIVIDGGSTDDSLRLLEWFTPWSSGRLQWISQPDAGPAAALNLGFRAALDDTRCDVVGWLNADDYYAEGAIERAVSAFEKNPHWLMVYGNARRIDHAGKDIGAIFTRRPDTPIESFYAGNFICQPTVFLRREAFEAGWLDESYLAAYALDWWLRIFKQYPHRIGFVDGVQAFQRAHPGSLAQRKPDLLALESLKAINSHLGLAPAQWVLKRVDTLCENYLRNPSDNPLPRQVQDFVLAALPGIAPSDRPAIVEALRNDERLRLARPNVYAAIDSDGWSGQRLVVRWRASPKLPGSAATGNAPRMLTLACRGGWPEPATLPLVVTPAVGEVQRFSVDAQREFAIQLSVPETNQGYTSWTIETNRHFVPAAHSISPDDHRKLSFRVESLHVG